MERELDRKTDQKECAKLSHIDWHDFVVIGFVEFTPEELVKCAGYAATLNTLPVPVTDKKMLPKILAAFRKEMQ